jgi:hypothetical protein
MPGVIKIPPASRKQVADATIDLVNLRGESGPGPRAKHKPMKGTLEELRFVFDVVCENKVEIFLKHEDSNE